MYFGIVCMYIIILIIMLPLKGRFKISCHGLSITPCTGCASVVLCCGCTQCRAVVGVPDETLFSSLNYSPQLEVPGAYTGNNQPIVLMCISRKQSAVAVLLQQFY